MNIFIFSILLFLATYKLWLYLLISIIVFLWQKRRPRTYVELKSEENLSFQVANDKQNFKRIKSIISSYVEGLKRLHVFWTAYIPSHHIRNFVYRKIYRANIGKQSIIYYGAELRAPELRR